MMHKMESACQLKIKKKKKITQHKRDDKTVRLTALAGSPNHEEMVSSRLSGSCY